MNNSENKYQAVKPIMEKLFLGYEKIPTNSMRPSIIYDDENYMINFLIRSDNHKLNKCLISDEIMDVELFFSNTKDQKLELDMVLNKSFQFKCMFEAKTNAERRIIYEAFELTRVLIVWHLDQEDHLLRIQKINFNFTSNLNVFNKYLLQV